MNGFCDSYSLKSFVKKPTCFKNLENPYYIDLMLTNSPNSYQNSCAIETGSSDFHKRPATVVKMKFQKLKPRLEHWDYKAQTFPNAKFSEYLLSKLPRENISPFEQGFSHGLP